ncbi:L-rhamnose mutarotase [Arenibacter sp. ARW7G5Y1]|uniref:L-rhamnose mutarotase n=1 Tax=Arenibacter sp. ARW7G5Y1 TaxID=2135619 RepID=UPI000D93CD51|nr:L-rhamnose mutarotase [Arenibacter sp. ARW7G5Y1]PXX30584.1 L-rhamnose mutarotase [Arenibacter sp. ARW7G5Y1]
MKKVIQVTLICCLLFFSNGCKQDIPQFDEYVFAVQLVNDSHKKREYLDYHKKVWPDVEKGFKKAGYHSIKLYIYDNYITMVVKVPKGTDLEQMGATKELNTDKVKDWNSLMSSYQKGLPGTTEGTTWVPMVKFYEFENNKSSND